jgi:hypothetical protein
LDEGGEFQAGAGAVAVEVGRMVVADDLDELVRIFHYAVAVVEDEAVAQEGIAGGEGPAGVVVAGDDADGDG